MMFQQDAYRIKKKDILNEIILLGRVGGVPQE